MDREAYIGVDVGKSRGGYIGFKEGGAPSGEAQG